MCAFALLNLSHDFFSSDASSRVHDLEHQILHERQRATREKELLAAQLEKASSDMEKMKSSAFLKQVCQYNHDLVRRKVTGTFSCQRITISRVLWERLLNRNQTFFCRHKFKHSYDNMCFGKVVTMTIM